MILTSKSDIEAVNEFQYLSAGQNIYFSRWRDGNYVASEAAKVTAERSKAKPMTTVFVRDYSVADKEVYKRGTPEEEAASKHEVIATAFQYPNPSSWPTPIRLRNKPKMYSNGSAIGYVRKPEWLEGRRVRRA